MSSCSASGLNEHSLQARSRVAEDISSGSTHRWVCIPSLIAALRFLSPKPGVLFVREALKALEKFFRQSGTILRGQLQSFDFEFLGAHDSILPRTDGGLGRNIAVPAFVPVLWPLSVIERDNQ